MNITPLGLGGCLLYPLCYNKVFENLTQISDTFVT